jgi:membrane protease YdiL (CAAX protease family)
VGSRAEAKSLRKAAQTAQRDRASAAKTAEKTSTRAVVRAQAGAVTGAVQWTNLDVAAILAVLVALLVGKEVVLASEYVSVMPAAGQTAARAVVMIVFYGALATALAFLSHRHGRTLIEAFGLRGTQTTTGYRAVTAGLVVVLLVATRVLAMGWGALAQAIGWQPPARAQLTEVFGAGGVGLILTGLAVVVVGPFIEELVFRGVVLSGATSRFALWPAISISAGLFALSHTTAWTLVPLFFLGLAAGWLATERHSLWAAISLHAAYNGIVVAAAFWLVR